jgi:hypothetical protein
MFMRCSFTAKCQVQVVQNLLLWLLAGGMASDKNAVWTSTGIKFNQGWPESHTQTVHDHKHGTVIAEGTVLTP